MSDGVKNNIGYIHFHTKELCNEVMNYILSISKIIDIKIINDTCCGGKGLRYFVNHKFILKYIIQKHEINKSIFHDTIIDKCNICYDIKELIRTCIIKNCNNHLCLECFETYKDNILKKDNLLSCPFCRTILQSNDICPFRFLMKELK